MLTAIMPAYSIDLQRIPFAGVSITTANIPRRVVPAGGLGGTSRFIRDATYGSANHGCHRDLHSQPPVKPARRKPLTMYWQFRVNRHNKPLR